jgi:hypothetical protein
VNPLASLLAVTVIVTGAFQLLWPGWQGVLRGQVGMERIDWIALLLIAVASLVAEIRRARSGGLRPAELRQNR